MGQRFPLPITRAMVLPAYVPVFTYSGGKPDTTPHTPVEHGTATVVVDDRGIGEYMPRTLADRQAQLGATNADPVTTPFGSVDPRTPYPTAATPAPLAPTLTTLTPNTATIGQPSIIVKATGTNFTPYSMVEVGGTNYAPTTYVSATELRFPIDTKNSSAGTITVKVLDHNIKTSAVNFTLT